MAAPKPSDVAAKNRDRLLRERLGHLADDFDEVSRIFSCFLEDLEGESTQEMHTAALLTLAVVLHHQPEEEEL
ncbi:MULTISPECIES: hypothetical protein [Corynebacterium]|uniref:Uncharacterized protein n=1 Tax=Corynebacterium ihumii TaxID=1232427 RepID=A0ABY7UAC9_9CORY|nr:MULTISPECIES: hypothetical protein [Corynebacterium]WCZ33637.1 hypothetical protein CIHUM_00945 [Corynebacterium ihumii]